MFSRRLIEIASLIPLASNVIDVGCDHGLLDIYLTLNRKCKCIASDVNENCLSQACENIKKFGLTNEIEVVQSDGLENVKYNKNDYIVIAGMGTDTILKILDKKKNIDHLIIQSNTDLTLLREELSDNYSIEDEKIIKERGIYYVIIKFKKGAKSYNDSDYIIGPIIKKQKEGIYKEYKEYLLKKYTDIYENVKDTSLNRRLEVGRIVKIIKKYL